MTSYYDRPTQKSPRKTPHPPLHAPAQADSRTPTTARSTVLCDPDLFESQLCSTELTIVLGTTTTSTAAGKKKKEDPAVLLNVYQAGAPLVDNPRETVKRCIAMARRRAEHLLRETLV